MATDSTSDKISVLNAIDCTLAEQYAEGFRAGQEAMRGRAALELEAIKHFSIRPQDVRYVQKNIRALPVEEPPAI